MTALRRFKALNEGEDGRNRPGCSPSSRVEMREPSSDYEIERKNEEIASVLPS